MVYLVDDDIDDLEIVQEALNYSSYDGPVKTAPNGLALMEDLKNTNPSGQPHVIVLDLNMPLKNGFEVLREMKSSPDLNTIPVIILTASSNKIDEARCLELGCAFYFKKPLKLHEYDPIIHQVKKFVL